MSRSPGIRGLVASVVTTIAAFQALICSALSDDVPALDVRPVCKGIASQSPDFLNLGLTEKFTGCVKSEQEIHQQLKKQWPTFSVADKKHCVSLVRTGGESTYTELITCLEMARDARLLRSARSASPSNPTVNPSIPKQSTTQSGRASAKQQIPGSSSQPSSNLQTELQQERTEAKASLTSETRAKADAETAKKSEALALRKAADAEEAVQRATKEAERAAIEAKKAKAEVNAARLAQASAQRELADVDIALLTLLFVVIVLAVTVFYLLIKLRNRRVLSIREARGVVPE